MQNCSKKYRCLKKPSSTFAWRRRLGFGDFVRWTRRHSKRTVHLQHLHLEFKEKVPPPCDTDVEVVTNVEVVEEFFNVKVVELFVEAEQSVVSEFFNIEVESEFFNIEVVTNVEWSSSISRWWTSSSTSRRGSSGSSRRGSCRRE